MDFGIRYLGGKSGGADSDKVGGFFIYGNQAKAYNAMDAGNWLWGHAMQKMGFSYTTAQQAADANEWWNDSPGDQRAIKSGFNYSTTTDTSKPFKLMNE